jgi:hypothetical protein
MVEKYTALLKACTSLDQLFTLASRIADEFKSQDDVLAYFETICVEQLYAIEARADAAGYQMLTVKPEA